MKNSLLTLILFVFSFATYNANAGFPYDLSDVVFTEAPQVKSWPVRATMDLSISGGNINMPYSASRSWPAITIFGTVVNANAWGIVKENGRWKAGTWEWLRVGQTTKKLEAFRTGHFKFIGTVPLRQGDLYGFFVSGTARSGRTNIAQRSNYVVYEWGKGVVYTEGQALPEPETQLLPFPAIDLLLKDDD